MPATKRKPRAPRETVLLIPTRDVPLPYDPDGDARMREPGAPLDRMRATAATATYIHHHHDPDQAPPDLTAKQFAEAKQALKEAAQDGKVSGLSQHPIAARAASQFLTSYGTSLALNAAQVRTALTNKLLELAGCGDPRYELRAIELLGKHNDINLFTERSEVNINYTTSEGLEAAIKERVKRLLAITHVTAEDRVYPTGDEEDDEPAHATIDAEYTVVMPESPEPEPDADFDWSSPFDE